MRTARIDVRGLYATSPVAAVGCFLIGLANGAFGTLGPVYGSRIGLPLASIATMMSGALIGGALLQVPFGRLSDRLDRRQVLIGVAAGAAVISLAIALLHPRTPGLITALTVLYGALAFPMYAICVAHANDFAGPGEFVRTSSGLLLLFGVGTMIGPLLAGIGMDRLAPEALFGFIALIDAGDHRLHDLPHAPAGAGGPPRTVHGYSDPAQRYPGECCPRPARGGRDRP